MEYIKKRRIKKKEIMEKEIIKPVKNKTDLEIWLENTKALNLNLIDLEAYIGSSLTCNYNNIYSKLEGFNSEQRAAILFNKWNKKIIKPLPQFRVIESIETITKVENNEGNQFFIGDVVKSEINIVQKIKSFKYSISKTNIIVLTDKSPIIGIGIDKIEHYIEPKVEVKEETLLEKAKRLYPIGTKYKCAYSGNQFTVILQNFSTISNTQIHGENSKGCLLYKDNWAKIIE